MRGKIIHYNRDNGDGIISVAGEKYNFNISNWSGSEAPSANMTVDFEPHASNAINISPINDSALMQEQAEIHYEKLKATSEQIRLRAIQKFGGPLIAAHVLFVFSGYFLACAKFGALGIGASLTLSQITSAMDAMGGLNHALYIAAVLSPLALLISEQRKLWLVFCLPLLSLLLTCYGAWSQYHESTQQLAQLSNQFGAFGGLANSELSQSGFTSIYKPAIGFYILLGSSIYLARISIGKFLMRT